MTKTPIGRKLGQKVKKGKLRPSYKAMRTRPPTFTAFNGRAFQYRDTPVEVAVGEPQRVYVVGDLATVTQDGEPVPGVAPAAIQMGRHAARNIVRAIAGLPAEPFRYRDKGSFATIGRGKAVGVLAGGLKLSGFPAWVAWLAIHIFFLIGFRNRVLVLFQWAYSYVTFRRGARLITGTPPPRLQ